MIFQYPRSDRAHCNGDPSGHHSCRQNLSVSSVGSSPLQHPSEAGRGWPEALSVSSVGSSPLQLQNQTKGLSHGRDLSVSSVGSSPLQPPHRNGGWTSTKRFQYPRSDRAHCNSPDPQRVRQAQNFQYPRSDRAHCNAANALANPRSYRLSVSSVGSSPLQRHRRSWGHHSGPLSVSSVGSSPLQPSISPLVMRSWPLSVSSVGSSPLQRRQRLTLEATLRTFQYPRSDRAHCNREPENREVIKSGAFSILGRIEPTATLQASRCTEDPTIFQYPRSDRAHCNLTVADASLAPHQVTFSILGRIEPTATPGPRLATARRKPLSVSSVGSSPLQQGEMAGKTTGKRTFSILGRIEPTATSLRHARSLDGGGTFSILGRIEPTATLALARRLIEEMNFQYPRSDRAHCNPFRVVSFQELAGPFSILGRIEPTATFPLPPGGPAGCCFQYPRSDRAHCNSERACGARRSHIFQYPRSDRAHCNNSSGEGSGATVWLSVSSVGSSPLQLALDIDEISDQDILSVSSVGSSPLQPARSASIASARLDFQYPRSDRAHCNVVGSPSSGASVSLSVSSVGSSPLQPPLWQLPCPLLRALSVSSVGSSPLQPRILSLQRSRIAPFSILGRIEPTATLASATTAWPF